MGERTADVVVVGGGAIGTSTAYHLARTGLKVTLVDRGSILSGCSSSTYAGVNVFFKETDAYMELSLKGRALWANLEEQLDADLEYRRPGSIYHIVEKESEWPEVLARVEEANQVPGVNMQVVRTPEAQQLEPALPPWIQGVTFCPGDGQVNPFKLVGAYAQAAKRHGAEIQAFTEVQGIEVRSGAVEAVVTSRGRIPTRWVVNAAGLESPRIGRMVGVTVPVVPSHGQVLTTVKVGPLVRYRLPYLLQKASGNLLVGPTHTYLGLTRDIQIRMIPYVAGKVLRLFPFLKEIPVERVWTGIRPWPLDGLPILGPVPEVQGFLIATTHSGIGMSEMVGRLMADLVAKGRTEEPIHHYSVNRFKGQRLSYAMQLYGESIADGGLDARVLRRP